ncbi:MAG TPA: hypothetical protein PLK99_03030 [Burkholderiales bacterium]|nr:hypothetical protein [Burkholderiales bacterium]
MYRMSFILIALLAVTGCASITESKLQPVSVQTVEGGKEVAGAGCTLTNDVGKWFVTTPGSVTIHKSTDDLSVDCTKQSEKGHEKIVSKANGGVWGNILVGGGIGYVVDRNTGAGFDYPTNITVVLHNLSEAIGLTPPKATPTPKAASSTPVASATTTPTQLKDK